MNIKVCVITINDYCHETIIRRASKKFGYSFIAETMPNEIILCIHDYKKFVKFVQPLIFHQSLFEVAYPEGHPLVK